MKTEAGTVEMIPWLTILGDWRSCRLRILRILPSEPSCEQACNVSKIAERIGLSQPSISHHLRILRQAGIITNQKMCRDVIYWVRPEVLSELQGELSEVLEGGV